jgi:hypothetical protein
MVYCKHRSDLPADTPRPSIKGFRLLINEIAYGYLCRTAARGRLTAIFDSTSICSAFELGNYFLIPSDFIFSRIASFMYSAIDL